MDELELLDINAEELVDPSKSFHQRLMDALDPDDPIATVFLRSGEKLRMRCSWTEEFIERNKELVGGGKIDLSARPRRKQVKSEEG